MKGVSGVGDDLVVGTVGAQVLRWEGIWSIGEIEGRPG